MPVAGQPTSTCGAPASGASSRASSLRWSPPPIVGWTRLTLWTTLEAVEGTLWVAGLSFVRRPENHEVYYASEQDATLWKRTPDGTWSEVWFLPGDVRRLEAIEGDRVGGVFVTRVCGAAC